jgi:hypothetical protein
MKYNVTYWSNNEKEKQTCALVQDNFTYAH